LSQVKNGVLPKSAPQTDPEERAPERLARRSPRRRVHAVMEAGSGSGPVGLAFEIFLIVLIISNAMAVTIESIPEIGDAYSALFNAFEVVSVVIFSVEYVLRVWTAPEDPRYSGNAVTGRLRMMLHPYMLIDLIAIVPAYAAIFMPTVDLRILRLFRLFRLLKIARYSPAVSTLIHVLSSERRALFGTLLLTLCVMSIMAECMYIVEGRVQPTVFGNLPECMYWAIVTLTTVGYGDKVPITGIGKLIAGITAIFGLGLFALPVGIIASGFMGEIHRRDFVLTTAMLSRIPVFANLDTEILGELMIVLRSQVVTEHMPIVEAGENATAMYFIVSGQAKAEGGIRSAILNPGEFFGGDAVLNSQAYASTIFAHTPMRLLALSRQDLIILLRKFPRLKRHMERASARIERRIAARYARAREAAAARAAAPAED
jgi:voltage-gated potassium channel